MRTRRSNSGLFILWIVMLVVCGFQMTTTLVGDRGKESQEVSREVLPSMVQIEVAEYGQRELVTVGSGVIVSADGWVLTAKHNISSSSRVSVRTTVGESFRVTYAIVDANRDLALLRFSPIVPIPVVAEDGTKTQKYVPYILTPIQISGVIPVPGQEIMTFGYPAHRVIGGLMATVAKGIVSALDRRIAEPSRQKESDDGVVSTSEPKQEYADLIELFGLDRKSYVEHLMQFDAMVNPGSSGGAVTNMDGELVGIINSMVSPVGASVGLNFAVEISEAREILAAAGITITSPRVENNGGE